MGPDEAKWAETLSEWRSRSEYYFKTDIGPKIAQEYLKISYYCCGEYIPSTVYIIYEYVDRLKDENRENISRNTNEKN